MALVIVHPDYMAFDEAKATSEYRAALYEEFLIYVREHYGDTAWFAQPRAVADHVRYHGKDLPKPAAARFARFERSA